MTIKEKYIKNKIMDNYGTYFNYFMSNPSKAHKKFGEFKNIESLLINKYTQEYRFMLLRVSGDYK